MPPLPRANDSVDVKDFDAVDVVVPALAATFACCCCQVAADTAAIDQNLIHPFLRQ